MVGALGALVTDRPLLAAKSSAVRDNGTSDPSLTAEEVLANNRAGKSEETLDVPSMIALYS